MNRPTAFVLGLAAGAGAVALSAPGPRRSLQSRVALVTGGSRGLGFLIARELIDAGCDVAICARDCDELEAARARLFIRSRGIAGARGGRILALPCDVSDRAMVAEMVRDVEAELGPIDILVNNAGVIMVGPEESMLDADYDEAMGVNFGGVLHVTRAVLPSMRARGRGSIANITSIGGTVPLPHMVPYTASKFAAYGLSQALAVELVRENIRVTTVVPGLMRTGSPVNSWFKGDPRAEFTWFGAGASTSLTAMNADRAARRIVRAIRDGERVLVLTWQAKLMRVAHALLPGMTASLAGLVNRTLPDDTSTDRWLGREVDEGFEGNPVFRPMYRAAWRNNEYVAAPWSEREGT